MTGSIVFETIRLWFHIETYTGKNEYKGGYLIKEGTSGHQRGQQRGQQRCSTTERRVMVKKDNSRNYNDIKKDNNSRWKWYHKRNKKEHKERKESNPNIEERRWINLGRR